MRTTSLNRVFYRVAGARDGLDGHDLLLMGNDCSCGGEHRGASPGCYGTPAFGCLWGAGRRTEDLAAYGAEVPLEFLTVRDAVAAAAPEDGERIIRASIIACQLMLNEMLFLDEEHYHDDADELASAIDNLRRQISVAAITSEIAVSSDMWKLIVELDAAAGTERQFTMRDTCICDHGSDFEGEHLHRHESAYESGGTVVQLSTERRHSVRSHGRNELCHCGSGRKFKHCHGR